MTTDVLHSPLNSSRGVSQRRVLRSEWTKIRTLRSTHLSLATGAAVMIGLGVTFAAANVSSWPKMSATARATFDPVATSLRGYILAQFAVAVLGCLAMAGEYRSGMIGATFAAVPQRLPVLWGKVAAVAAVVFGVMLVVSLAAFFAGQSVLAGKQIDASLATPNAVRAIVGCALYLTVVAIFGVALGAILRNSAAAIAAAIGILFILPVVMRLAPTDFTNSVSKFLPSQAGQAVIQAVESPSWLAPWTGFAVLCGYVIFATVIGALLLRGRDA